MMMMTIKRLLKRVYYLPVILLLTATCCVVSRVQGDTVQSGLQDDQIHEDLDEVVMRWTTHVITDHSSFQTSKLETLIGSYPEAGTAPDENATEGFISHLISKQDNKSLHCSLRDDSPPPPRLVPLSGQTSDRISEKCKSQLQLTIDEMSKGEVWPLKMWDASGLRTVVGHVMSGTFQSLGNLQQCLALDGSHVDDDHKLTVHYCTATVTVPQLLRPGEPPARQDTRLLVPGDLQSSNPLVDHLNRKLLPALSGSTVDKVYIGLCAPRDCSAEDLETLLNHMTSELLNYSGPPLMNVTRNLCIHPGMEPVSYHDSQSLTRYSTIAYRGLNVLVALATLVDLLLVRIFPSKTKKCHNLMIVKILLSFSIIANLKQIFRIDWNESSSKKKENREADHGGHGGSDAAPVVSRRESLKFLAGFRALNSMAFIGVHCCIISVLVFPAAQHRVTKFYTRPDNPEKSDPSHVTYSTLVSLGMLVLYSLDSLICLSGFLLAVLGLPTWERIFVRARLLPALKTYVGYLVHRWIRLVPVFLVFICLVLSENFNYQYGAIPFPSLLVGHIPGIPSLGWNPLRFHMDPMQATHMRENLRLCSRTWWHSLVPLAYFQEESIMDECLPFGWSITVDIQLYLIAPLILLIFWYFGGGGGKSIKPITLIGILSSSGYNYWRISSNPALVRFFSGFYILHMLGSQNFLYWYGQTVTRWYTHLGPFILGLAIGFRYYYQKDPTESATKESSASFSLPKGWITAGCALALIILPPRYLFSEWSTQYLTQNTELLTHARLLFIAAYPTAWACIMGMFIWHCVTHPAGGLARFLSHPLWSPAARLSFCIYITQCVVIGPLVGSLSAEGNPFDISNVSCFWGVFLLSSLVIHHQALVLYLQAEGPANRIFKLLGL